ncbi:MAG: carboxypeptidase regulatory-like domain-containing protein [Chloroflexi bacterium]|nr:carboxypeptidase regulatory-like domain-containing protein [Chloroflexota bacterium]
MARRNSTTPITKPVVHFSQDAKAAQQAAALQSRFEGEDPAPPPIANFAGLQFSEFGAGWPPDTVGDVGPNHYIQMVNVKMAVYDKSGTPLFGPVDINSLWDGFGGPCETTNDGDPIVLFDQLANRWFMSQFALPNIGTDAGPFYQCIAISQSGDPTGAYHRYAFLWSNTKLNDYPKFGVWPDGYYMSINQFTAPSFSFSGAGVAVFDRARMLSGLSASMISFDLFSVNQNFGGQLPSDWDGPTPPAPGTPNYFFEVDDSTISPGLGPNDALRIWKFHVDWTTPANSTFGVSGTPNYTLTVSPYNVLCSSTRSCIPQPSTTARLDAIGDRLMHRAQYRIVNGQERVVLNHTVDAGSARAGVRWYEIRDPGTAPAIYQQSTYAPADTAHRWMASIAMDHVGNIALGYSVSSGTVFPGVRYTGRLTSDPLGVMAQGEASMIEGTGSQTDSAARWGDYSSMNVDPVDDCTFWYTQEYYATVSARDWHTRIGSFRFPNCTAGPQGALIGQVTNASNSNPIVGARINATLSPTQTFSAFSNPGGNYTIIALAGSYTVTGAAYGYLPATISGVSIVSGTTTTQNIALTPAASYVISGFVKDSVTNNPLMATVAVIGAPFNPPFASVTTDPSTGFYSMTVSGGQSYTLTASALLHTAASQGVIPVGNTTVNFNLVATTQNGGIVGWVRNFYTNAPIANATVTVATAGNPNDQTDANGYFEIFNLTPGVYSATATANLYSAVTLSNIQVLSSNIAMRTFLLPTSQLNYNPPQLQKTLVLGQVATDTAGLVISNTGVGSLSFALQEQRGGFAPLRPTVGNILVVAANSTAAATTAITQALQALGYTYDVSASRAAFEALTVPQLLAYQAVIYSGPTDISTLTTDNPSNTLLRSYLDAGGRVLHADNDEGYYDNPSTYYQQYLQATYGGDDPGTDQALTGEDIMAGIDTNVTSDSFPDYFTPGAEGTRIFKYTAYNSAAGSRTARNSYKALYLAFDYQNLGTSAIGDQVETDVMQRSLTWLLGGAPLDLVPWFSQTPLTGTLAQSASQNIQIGWDASVADITQPGTYTATLRINNNDPAAQNTALPVALTVLPASNQGYLTGVVSTTGVCDVNLAPVNGVPIFIQGSAGFGVTVTTDAAGQYGYWLAAAQSPYTATVSYPDHLTTAYSVNVSVGVTTTRNFTLRLQKPCINVNPKALQATLQLGTALTRTLYVTSTGATPLNFNLYEAPPSALTNAPLDAFGYTWITATYNWIDATGGTALGLTDDGEANVVSPFAFPFYGGSSVDLRVGNNGGILFGVTAGDVSLTNAALASAPDSFMAPFWDDMDDETGNVYWLVTGAAPNRKLVVEWHSRPHYNGIGGATFEMVLYENGNILYQYQDVDFGDPALNNGASATVGIRGVGAANSVEYSFNQPTINNNQAVCFVRPGNLPCGAINYPWLSESITSTVGLTGTPPSSQSINVVFDASQVALPGVYNADLVFGNNSPQGAARIPVTLTVTLTPVLNKLYLPLIRK